MINSSILFTLEDSDYLQKVAQCPILFVSDQKNMNGLVSTRTEQNQSKVVFFYKDESGVSFNFSNLLLPFDLDSKCKGVMATDFLQVGKEDFVLFGHAYFLEANLLFSKLFSIPFKLRNNSIDIYFEEVNWLFKEPKLSDRFRSAPGVYKDESGVFLIYSAGQKYSESPDIDQSGYPLNYGLHISRLSNTLDTLFDEKELFWPEHKGAFARPNSNGSQDRTVWFSSRGIASKSDGYSLGKLVLDSDQRALSSSLNLLEPRMFPDFLPDDTFAYPFVGANGKNEIFVSFGIYGSKGVALISTE